MQKRERVEAAWAQMARVRRLTLKVTTDGDVRRGTGGVEVSRPAPDVLRWAARGRWDGSGRTALAFRSAYEWRRREARLHLAHLRLGPDHPVPLVELVPSAEAGVLASVRPHRCGRDRYAARLIAGAGAVELHWRIIGPAKNIHLQQRYHE